MRHRDKMVLELKVERLDILREVRTCCRITDMPDTSVAFQVGQDRRRKDIGYETGSLEFMEVRAVKSRYPGALLATVLESIQGIIELDGCTASIHDANDTAHDKSLMRWDFRPLCVPLVVADFCAPAKTAGRADFLLGMERDLSAAPAGDVGELVHLTH